ncbi:MAG: outer membrane beta-barrel protein [Opitutae bacterium]
MKLLRTLALLPLAAAASQAATIEFQFGKSNPVGSNYDSGAKYNSGTLTGITVAGNLNRDLELGLNLNYKHLATDAVDTFTNSNIGILNASLDLTYDLNPRGGISPFVGIGLGYAWLSNLNYTDDGVNPVTPVTTSKGLFTASAFVGVRFAINKKLDFSLTARDTHYIGLKNYDGTAKSNIQNWEAIAGLRYRF